MKQPVIFFVGSGIGRDLRGFEAHITDLFNHVKHERGFDSYLMKTTGQQTLSEIVIRSFGRKSGIAKAFGFILRKNPLFVQQLSFLIRLIPLIQRYKPAVLYLGEPILFNYLYRWRNFSGMKFRMIFFTGGNTVPLKMRSDDLLQLVTPVVIPLAMERGITKEQMVLLPHFLDMKPSAPAERQVIRKRLGIPENHLVVLSVGAIDASIKRMDYLIEEVSRLTMPYYLIILGEYESETPMIRQLAETKLGNENFILDRVERSALADFYAVSDIFVLASLNEGFGLVTIEAMYHGLPVLVHHHQVAKYVLGGMGSYSDLSQTGNLTKLMEVTKFNDMIEAQRRNHYVKERFSWTTLSSDYLKLLGS